jgi:hypothetical protein
VLERVVQTGQTHSEVAPFARRGSWAKLAVREPYE